MINLRDVRKDTHEKRGAKEGEETDWSKIHGSKQRNRVLFIFFVFSSVSTSREFFFCDYLDGEVAPLSTSAVMNSGVAEASGDWRPSNRFPDSCSAVNNKPAFVPVYWSASRGRSTTACTGPSSRNLQKRSTTISQIFQSNKRHGSLPGIGISNHQEIFQEFQQQQVNPSFA